MISNQYLNQNLSLYNKPKAQSTVQNTPQEESLVKDISKNKPASISAETLPNVYDTNATDIIAENNKIILGLDKQNTGITSTLNGYYDTYKNEYSYLFAPKVTDFDTVYKSAINIVNTMWQPPSEPTKDEYSADFNYVLRYQINECLWNNAQDAASDTNVTSSRTASAPSNTSIKASELNGKTYKGPNGVTIVVDTNFMNDGKGNIVCDPADFAPNAKFTITDKSGNSSDVFISTDDFDISKFTSTLDQIANVLGELSDTALKDFQDEIMFVNINKEAIEGVAGSYVPTTNAISLNGNQFITKNIFTHELGHAIDNIGAGDTMYSDQDVEAFNSIKDAIIKFCPEAAESYPLTSVQEFFAEWYVQANYKESGHMSDLIQLLTDKYDSVVNNPKSTANDKVAANALIKSFNEFVTNMRDNRREITKMDSSERFGSNLGYGLNNLTINTIIKDKSIVNNFYLLAKLGIVDAKYGLKHFLMDAFDGGSDSVTLSVSMGLLSMGEQLIKQGLPVEKLTDLSQKFMDQCSDVIEQASKMGLTSNLSTGNIAQYKTPTTNTSSGSGGGSDINKFNSEFNFDNINSNSTTQKFDNNFNTLNSANNNSTGSSSSSTPSPTIPTPELKNPNLNDLFKTPDLNNNPEVKGIETTTDSYEFKGNINDSFGNDAQIPENKNSLDNKTAEEKFNDAVKDAENKAIENAREKYGWDSEITTDTKITIDENGNFQVKIDVIVKGDLVNGTPNSNGNSIGNTNQSANGLNSIGTGAGTGKGSLASLAGGTDKVGSSGISSNNGTWNGSFGQSIIYNYGNSDGTLNTDQMINDWANAGGDVVTYTNNGNGTWSTSSGYSGYTGGVGDHGSYNGYTTGNEDWSWTGFDVFSPGGGWDDPLGTMSFYGNGGGFGGDDMVENGEPLANHGPDKNKNCNFMQQADAR